MKKLLFLLVLMLSMTTSSLFATPQVVMDETEEPANEGVVIDRSAWVVTASTEEPAEGNNNGYVRAAIDNDKATYWHTQWSSAKPTVPHWIQFDMGETYEIIAFDYVSRAAKAVQHNGNVKTYKLYISNDDISANIDANKVPVGLEPVMEGEFVYDEKSTNHLVTLQEVVEGRYVYMLITDTYNEDPNTKFANCAEFYVYRTGVATKYEVTTVASPADYGTATVNGKSSDEVAENSFIILSANANAGYEFINWTKNGEFVSFESVIEISATEAAEYVANFAEIVEETEYSTYSGNITRDDRRLASFKISNGVEDVKVKGIESKGRVYVNRSKHAVLSVQPGDVITFPEFNWVGVWMHAYAYIDYNNDKQFNTVINQDGTTDGELVTYNCYNGVVSNGQSADNVSNACTIEYTNNFGKSVGLPAFKLPEVLEPGEYRMRISVAWNTLSPDGYSTIAGDGGILLDMTLLVGASDKYRVRVSAADNNGKVYIDAENTTTKFVANDGEQTVVLKAEPNENYDFLNWTLNGEVVSTDAEYTTTAITENRDYIANFVFAGKCSLDSDVAEGEGTIAFYDEKGNAIEDGKISSGAKVRIVVTPAEGYILDAVYYNYEEMEVTDPASWTLEVVVTADIIVEAYFEENAEASVEETVVDAAQVSVAGRTIVVNGYTGAVRVVNVCGQTVAEVAANGKAEINVARGIYIVVAGSQANKVLVK